MADEKKEEGWEKSWEEANNFFKEGVNPSAYRLGWIESKDEIKRLRSNVYEIAIKSQERELELILMLKRAIKEAEKLWIFADMRGTDTKHGWFFKECESLIDGSKLPELKSKIQSLHKGESNDLMDKGWNEAIEHITKNIL